MPKKNGLSRMTFSFPFGPGRHCRMSLVVRSWA